jgi:hypothetical protein
LAAERVRSLKITHLAEIQESFYFYSKMSNYGSIDNNKEDNSTEVDALIEDGIPLVDRPPPSSKKWYLAGGFVTLLLLMVFSRSRTDDLDASLSNGVGALCTPSFDLCGSNICCPTTLLGTLGKCQACCANSDCMSKIEQPPAGEYGKPFCLENECRASPEGGGFPIPKKGYTVWNPSETIDNSHEFQNYEMPRTLYSDVPATPAFEHLWYIDFNEQDPSLFNKNEVYVNETHVMIPKGMPMHAGYSKSYHMYDEHETGVVTLITLENDYSMVADYPKLSFVEKYHTLTYDGKKDTTRGDFFNQMAETQMDYIPWTKSNLLGWAYKAFLITKAVFATNTIDAQVEAGVDRALTWQIRRYVNSYPKADTGSLNPSSSGSWASHTEKAKQAYKLAKDDNFKREYVKSEQHCKHFEQTDGIGETPTHSIFPLGRPITTYSGEMVTSPVYYLGFIVGHVTFDYDKSGVLQILYQGYSVSRQYMDVKFPGPYDNGLYVSPVAKGIDYVVDPDTDGRTNVFLKADQPEDIGTDPEEAEYTLWARPRSETCDPIFEDGDFWEKIDLKKGESSIWSGLVNTVDVLQGVVGGMPCANIWMRADYGRGSHGFGTAESGVWGHFLTEVTDKKTKKFGLAKFWDSWECFYRNKEQALCAKD